MGQDTSHPTRLTTDIEDIKIIKGNCFQIIYNNGGKKKSITYETKSEADLQ